MFCSKCGKTLTMEDQQCPYCGNPVGESRFEGTPYTSAQSQIPPEGQVKQAPASYTRTTYTTMPENQQTGGAVDSRTTYRPVYEGASAPEEVRRDMRAAFNDGQKQRTGGRIEDLSDEAKDTLNAVDEELQLEDMDTSDLRTRPIASTGRAGISAGVEDYIQKLEANQTRRANRRRRIQEVPVEEDAYVTPEDGQPVYEEYPDDAYDGQSEVFDDIPEEEYDDMGGGRTLGLQDILKVAAAMVVLAALVVGGVLWFRHMRDNVSSARIEGVSETLYTNGIALIKSHTDQAYVTELKNLYASNGYLGVANRAANDSAAIDALMPGEPSGNDSLFVEALQTIQKNIGSAVLMDAMQAESGADPNGEQSQSRWSIVNSAISELESATTATDLTAILNGEKITVVTEATPAPTPEAVTYQTLSKGAKSDAVLALQNRLYELGYLNDDRDGNFGNKTQTAVKLFQSAVGIEATGIADSATQERLFADDAPRNGGAVTPPPATAADDLFDNVDTGNTTAALPDDEDDFAIAYEFGNSEEDLA